MTSTIPSLFSSVILSKYEELKDCVLKTPTAPINSPNSPVSPRLLISSGSYGKVYKSIDLENKEYAEKEMYLYHPNTSKLIQQNIREANFHAWFPKNEHIITCDKIFIKDNILSFVMPLGKMSLHDYIRSTNTSIRIPHFYSILSQICIGLSPLHSNNVYHNDIKPQNILIDPITMKISIIDLGGIRFEHNVTLSHPTTLTYAPPEFFNEYPDKNINLKPEKKFGSHNDMWSLGITMLEFLTGRNYLLPLFYSSNKNEIGELINSNKQFPLTKIRLENGFNISSINSNIEIITIISKMLNRDIEKRISFSELYCILNNTCIPTYVKTYPVEFINQKFENEFKFAIKQVSNFIKKRKRNENYCYSFELAISIFNRYCMKRGEFPNENILFQCLFIATSFLTDSFYNLFTVNKKIVDDILTILQFDIYRPTLLNHIQEINGKVGYDDINVAFDIISDVNNVGKSINELFYIFSSKIYSKDAAIRFVSILFNSSQNSNLNNFKSCIFYYNFFNHIVNHDLIYKYFINNHHYLLVAINSKLKDLEKQNLTCSNKYNPKIWAPIMKVKLFL